MKRLHIHLKVEDIEKSVAFYEALFGVKPAVLKNDYAKWMLDDPVANIAISTHGGKPGLDHVGIQIDEPEMLAAYTDRLREKQAPIFEEAETTCCYAKSNKTWVTDPQGAKWELFQSYDWSDTYGAEPDREKLEEIVAANSDDACCGPKETGTCCEAS